MTKRLVTSIAASVILIAGTAIGLLFMHIGPKGNATNQMAGSSRTDGDHSTRKAEEREVVPAQEERKLAEVRRQVERAQQREAEQLGMILALRHEEHQPPAEPQEPHRERQAHTPGQQHIVPHQHAHPEQRVAEASRQAERQHVAQGEARKLADAPREHARHGARSKTAQRSACAAPCPAKAGKPRASGRRTANRGRAPHGSPPYFMCPFFERLHVALAELTTPASPDWRRRSAARS